MGYIPRRDVELLNWARNFAARVGEDPARLGLRPEQAQTIQTVVAAFAAAYARAAAPISRTAAAVAAKDAAAKVMLKELRGYAMVIKRSRAVADADKVNLGLNVTQPSLARLPAPTSRPILSVESGAPLCHVLRCVDSEAPERRGRPRGVAGLELVCHLGDKAPAGPDGARHAALTGRTFYRHSFPASAAGQRAHYWARWYTRRGLMGPWSQRVSLVVAG